MSNGGVAISDDRKTIAFGEPAAVEAASVMRDMVDAGAFSRGDQNGILDAMSSGNLGMFLTSSVYMAALQSAAKDKWEVRLAPMPSFGDKPTRPTNSGAALFLFSQDPVKQRAAWELMKYLTSDAGYTVITRDIGYLPLRADIVDDPRYLADWAKANPMVRPNLEQLSRLTPNRPMAGPNYRQIESMMLDAFDEAIFGEGDVATVLQDAQARAQALMPQ
jgi:multiple sugar transport system substrate-binding protein